MTSGKDYFETFRNLSQVFGTAATVDELLQLIVSTAVETMGGKAACLYLDDQELDLFVAKAKFGLSDKYIHASPIKAQKVNLALEKKGYLVFEDATSDPRLENHEAKKAEGIASILTVGVMVDGSLIGVRAPLAEHEEPIIRTYVAVDDIESAIKAGASTINIPDTVGYAVPEEFAALIAMLFDRVPNIDKAVISVHCHNDLGLAVANSLSAIQAGARQIEGHHARPAGAPDLGDQRVFEHQRGGGQPPHRHGDVVLGIGQAECAHGARQRRFACNRHGLIARVGRVRDRRRPNVCELCPVLVANHVCDSCRASETRLTERSRAGR